MSAPAFTLDTSGEVYPVVGHKGSALHGAVKWPDLSPFAQGYIEALFQSWRDPWTGETATRWAPQSRDQGETWTWVPVGPDKDETAWWDDSDTDPERRPCFEPIDAIGFSNLAPETLARIIADCEAAEAMPYDEGTPGDPREFWADRQSGEWVTFPPLKVTLGDDGKVRLTDGEG